MERVSKYAVSAVIVFLIGLQTAASFGGFHRYRYWPFLSYPMYNRPHFKDEAVARYSLVGILKDGTERPITPEDLRLDFWRYLRGPVRFAQRDEAHALLSQLQPFEHRARLRFAAVRLDNHPVRLEKGKLKDLPVESKTVVLRKAR